MADTRVIECDLTVAPGTIAAAPATAVFGNDTGTVSRVRLTVPDGHNGLTGWQLLLAGTPIIPYQGDTWLVANGEQFTWELDQAVNAGQLSVAGYNSGIYPHTFYARADWSAVSTAAPAAVLAVPSSAADDTTTAAVAGLDQIEADTGDTDDTGQDDTDIGSPGDIPVADVDSFAPPPDTDTTTAPDEAPDVAVPLAPVAKATAKAAPKPAAKKAAPPRTAHTAPDKPAARPQPRAAAKKPVKR